MTRANIGQLVAEAWEKMTEESPDIFDQRGRTFGPGWTYRQMLDYQPVNAGGRLIPRIVTVQRNIRDLKEGNTRRWRGLNVKDRRQNPERRRR